MTTQSKDARINELSEAVNETLAWFEGPGQRSSKRIADWGPWEVLAHFAYWHYATGWAVRSAILGRPPWQLSGSADEMNAAALALMAGDSPASVVGTLRSAHARLVSALRTTRQTFEATAFRMGRRPNGFYRAAAGDHRPGTGAVISTHYAKTDSRGQTPLCTERLEPPGLSRASGVLLTIQPRKGCGFSLGLGDFAPARNQPPNRLVDRPATGTSRGIHDVERRKDKHVHD